MMRTRSTWLGWVLMAATATVSTAAPPPSNVEQLVTCMRANLPQQGQLALKTRTLDARGEVSSRGLTVYSRRGDDVQQASVHVTAPHDLSGSAYLLQKKNGQELTLSYLPAIGRVQRITGESNGSILGTTLSANDVRHVLSGFADGSLLIGPNGTLNGWTTKRVYVTAPPGQSNQYDKIELEVTQPECVVAEARFYANNRLLKKISAVPDSLTSQGRYHYIRKFDVSTPKDPLHTELEIVNFEADVKIDDARFDPHSFYRR